VIHEIDFRKATHDDIAKFAMNLLQLDKSNRPGDYEAQIAYFSAQVQVLLGWRSFESAARVANEVDQARAAVGKGLDKLERRIS
jgi:hypothetical protein